MEGSEGLGKIVFDKIGLLENDPDLEFVIPFGCLTVSNSVHLNQFVSIVGLSPNPVENILYSWFNKHPEDYFKFSTCMTNGDGFLEIGVNPEDKQD